VTTVATLNATYDRAVVARHRDHVPGHPVDRLSELALSEPESLSLIDTIRRELAA
jgi:hypothetical protein